MSFEVVRNGHGLAVRFPPAAFARLALGSLPEGVSGRLSPGEATFEGDPATVEHVAARLFGSLNGYPTFPDGTLESFENAPEPLVSCIVLLPFNDVFARNFLLPGIVHSSRGHAIEIIVVLAGFGVDVRPFSGMRVVESELACIAKGYNRGVQAARGEYVALFHDDCVLDDPHWIDKALSALRPPVAAVAPELNDWNGVPFAKAVPLVMRRRDYLEVGGYDEHYYVGVEDVDLACTLYGMGMRVEHLPLSSMHLRGMGTALVVHERPRQLKLLFGHGVLPREVLAAVHRDSLARLLSHDFIRILDADYHLHFLDKHGPLLAESFGVDVAGRRRQYEWARYRHGITADLVLARTREKLLGAYRGLMNTEELEEPVPA